MEDTTWKVSEREGEFRLTVRVESDVRPKRTLVWEGHIKVTESGGASLDRMNLMGIEGENAEEGEKPGAKESSRVLRDLILDNTTNSGSASLIIKKVARACRTDSHRLEEVLEERAARNLRERTRRDETTRELRELTQLGEKQGAGKR